MNEKWEKWHPVEGLPEKVDLPNLCFDKNGLRLEMVGVDHYERIIFQYESTLSFRLTDEGRRLRLLSYLNDNYGKDFLGKWSFFKIMDSPYVRWLNEETYGIYEQYEVEHHAFLTTNEVVEVISATMPIIIISPVQ